MFKIRQKGDYSKATKYLISIKDRVSKANLNKYGQKGVEALSSATPVDTGKTAASWSYEISKGSHGAKIEFKNSNINKNVNIAIILQYGHGTRNGGYVQGRDYINPAIQSVFEEMANDLWNEVTRL